MHSLLFEAGYADLEDHGRGGKRWGNVLLFHVQFLLKICPPNTVVQYL